MCVPVPASPDDTEWVLLWLAGGDGSVADDEGMDARRLWQLQSDDADGSLTGDRSQCFFWKMGMSEKAQNRWVLIRELDSVS